MAISWGGWNGHLRVGIEVRNDAFTSSTPNINVYVDVYVQCDSSWNFNDSQTVTLSGSTSGSWTFQNTLGPNASIKVGTATIPDRVQVYGGGPTYSFTAKLSGAYNGAAPTHSISWALPAKPATIPGAPGVTISSVTANSAKVTVSAAASNGSTILEYETRYATTSAFTTPIAVPSGGSITGLAAATTYYARSRARNGVGWGPYSTTKSFTTGATVPGVPGGFAVSNVGQTGATLAWTAPASGGSTIDDYTVQAATDSGFTTGVLTITVDAPATGYTFSGLTPGQKYYTRVRANNGVGSGSYTAASSFTTLAGTPTIVSPVQNGTYGNGIVDVTVSALGIASDRTITLEVSQSSTFASGVLTTTLTPSGPSSNNQYRLTNANQYLKTGTWYARTKVTNLTTGYVTPWSSTVTFTQAHTPSATAVSPTAGAIYQYGPTTPFAWKIIDSAAPNDWQTAYRLVIEDNATGAIVFDSGKVALVTNPSNTTVTVSVALAATYKTVPLRWKVMVWDRADTASAYTGYGLFTLADPPVITVVKPAPTLPMDNGSPTFQWSLAIPSGGTQVSAVVKVYDADTNTLVWTGTVAGQGTSVTPTVVILRNAASYYFTITVTDSTGLVGTVTSSFDTDYNAPDPFEYFVIANQADALGYVDIQWPDANPDDLFAAWKVYRRTLTSQWEAIATITNQNVRSYHDFMLTAGPQYSYSVTQVATRSGVLLESAVGYYTVGAQQVQETRYYPVDLTYYWIVNPDNPDLSVRLLNVVSNDSTLEFEKATYTIVGRGRHVDYGDELGYTGTLTCEVRVPERPSQFKLTIEALRRTQETYYLRTPFGQLFPIALGNLDWKPLSGVGTSEMGDMSISYEEVH